MKKPVFALTAVLITNVGCLSIQPIGPMADMLGVEEPKVTQTATPGVRVSPAQDASRRPMLPPAPPPEPPAFLVTPGEVSDASADEIIRKLDQELDADRKAMSNMPGYAEISVIR